MTKKVLVTGGRGMLGREVVALLSARQMKVDVLSSRPEPIKGVGLIHASLNDKAALQRVVGGYEFVIHCASNPINPQEADVAGTHNLLEAINPSVLKHLIYVSIIGVDKSDHAYYQAKYSAEKLIAKKPIGFSILRTTQFYDFIYWMFIQSATRNERVFRIPFGMKFQGIALKEVAARMAEMVNEKPTQSVELMGGPEVLDFKSMAELYLQLSASAAIIEEDNGKNDLVKLFRSGVHLSPAHARGTVTWKKFLEDKLR